MIANLVLLFSDHHPRLRQWLFEVPVQKTSVRTQAISAIATAVILCILASQVSRDDYGYLVRDLGNALQQVTWTYSNQAPGVLALVVTGIACWCLWEGLRSFLKGS